MKKLLVILLVLGLAAPAMASDWYFYGSARTHLGYYMVDENYGTSFPAGPDTDATIRGGNAGDDDSGTLLNLYGQSRFGAKAVVSDNLTGNFEVGLSETNNSTSDEERVYLRLLYGTWNFGAGKLSVGKRYTPATFLGYSGMQADLGDNGDAVMLVSGLAYIGRQPQIRLTFGGFDAALIQPNTAAGDLGFGDIDFTIPRFEMSYVFRTPVIAIRPVFAFQTYEVESATDSEDVTSFTGGLGISLKLGPAYIKMTASYVRNPRDYGQANFLVADAYYTFNAGQANYVGGDVENSDLIQGTFVVGANFNKSVGLEAGFGYGNLECETSAFGDVEQTGMVFYLQAPITLAKGVKIIPEIGYMDRDDLEVESLGGDVDAGDMTYIDINFKVDF